MAIAAAGCGDDDDRGDPAAARRIAEGAERTLEAGSARQTIALRAGDEVDFTMTGIVDLERDDTRARITYRKFPDLEPGEQVDMITFDEVDYFRSVGDRRWVKTETTADDAVSNALDVPSSLRTLGGITDQVEDHGPEDLDGAPTTRYTGSVDPDEVAETLPPAQAERYREMAKALGGEDLPVEIWLDPEGRIRQVVYDLDVDRPGPLSGSERVVARIALSDFGVRARIAPPPPRLTVTE